jgi:riboflavin kinase / FMN adenylyltransferase
MRLAHNIEEIPFQKNSIITIGTFDGIHLAHQKILNEVLFQTRKRKGRSVLITFEPHPRDIVGEGTEEIKLLTSVQERQELCEKYGIEWFVVMPFDLNFAKLNFREFYVQYLIEKIGISAVIEGYDHHWGKNRGGNIDALKDIGKEFNFDVISIEPFFHNSIPVNSSLIRKELSLGFVEKAAELLNRSYALRGKVVEGDRRGKLLGYPTANIMLESEKKLLPKDGIYFVRVTIGNEKYFGMTSIGVRPTFHVNGYRTIEVNILDFDTNIYGYDLRMDFLRRLRDELKFDSPEQLIEQMHKDKVVSKKLQLEYQEFV